MSNNASVAGVLVLGIVAIICVVGVLKLATGDVQDQTRTKVTSADPKSRGGQPPLAPQITEVATPQDSTGLSILGTIASAAVGGIAGMLTMFRAGEAKAQRDRPPGSGTPAARGPG